MAQRTTQDAPAAPDAGTYTGPTITEMGEAWERSLRSAGRRPETIRTYMAAVAQFDAFAADTGLPREVGKLTREHVELFIIHLGETRSQSTAKTRFGALKTFFGYVCDEEPAEVPANPMARMKAPTVDELDTPVPDPDDLRRLLDACKGTSFDDRRDRALFMLATDTGLRRGELAGLSMDDVDVRAQLARVESGTSKSRRNRVVRFGGETANALQRYERMRRRHPKAQTTDRFWIGKLGPLTGAGILQILHRRCDDAGIDRMHPHQLRHYFASTMKARGWSDEALMVAGGWRSHQQVVRYGRAEAQRRTLDLYEQTVSPVDGL